jgi:hypothetical protein
MPIHFQWGGHKKFEKLKRKIIMYINFLSAFISFTIKHKNVIQWQIKKIQDQSQVTLSGYVNVNHF